MIPSKNKLESRLRVDLDILISDTIGFNLRERLRNGVDYQIKIYIADSLGRRLRWTLLRSLNESLGYDTKNKTHSKVGVD